MKDLIGYLKKILFLSSLATFFIPFSTVLATDNFNIYTAFQHTLVEQEVETQVILQIKSDTPKVISYYTASIPIKDLQTTCKNYKTGESVDCTLYPRGSVTDVLMNLNNSVVRPDLPLEIVLNYTSTIPEGNTYTLPSKISDTTTNSILIRYPKEKGEPLWSSDPIQNIKAVGDNFEIVVNKPVYSSISLLFGENVTYRFEISKVFANSLDGENQTFEIYVPSDSDKQMIIWDEITPLPNSTLLDEDGNYIFKYVVAPEESLDCKISGYIQMISPIPSDTSKSFYTQESGYWSIKNSTEFRRINTYLQKKGLGIEEGFDDVNDLSETDRELFYKYIYQYVIERLDYDKNIELGITNETRLGANALTEEPNNASSTDYSDFYISILRKYNVPSRMVVGYVSNITGYSADGFYHHWVEYYDLGSKTWNTSDPFLEEYFEKNLFGSAFFDHIAILRRGKSAVAPKISFFNDSDFIVTSETKEEVIPLFDIDAELTFEEYKITNKYLKGYVHISNMGNTTINNYQITTSNVIDIQKYIDPVNNINSVIILPKQSNFFQLNIPNEKLESSNIFLNILFNNGNLQEKELILEETTEQIIPGSIIFVAKILSFAIFVGMSFLIYFLIRILKKNG